MTNKTSNDLGRDSIGKLLFRLAVPSITAQVVNMLYNIVDRIYIGHIPGIGATALTGVGVTFPIIMIIAAFSSLTGMGGGPRASICMGQGKYDEAERILGNCFVTLLGISVALTALFLLTGEPLLYLFGASDDTLPYGLSYMNIYVSGTIFVQMALGLNSFITIQGRAKTSMLTVVIGAVANIALDPLFIFVFDMGVQGAAIATIISQALSSVWVLWFLMGKRTKLKIRRKYLQIKWSIVEPVLALGVSPFVMQSTESLVNIALNSSLQWYGGDIAVGSMTILSSLMQVFTLPLTGLTQGAQPIISFNYGAGNNDRVKRAFKLLILYGFGFACAFWLTVMCMPQVLISLFTSDPELIGFASWSVRIYLAAIFMMGAQISCQQTFIAVGQAKISLFLATLRKIIILIPLIYILPNFLSDQVFAVFLAEPIADAVASVVTVTIFFLRFKKLLDNNPNILKHQASISLEED
ncbi:Multidrug export protein MepA [Eubacteriaceae bacterium CHKCI005]|nr:Multidrug export protein MepA [Eubacteriaceae bacterium CHKCI005]